MFACNACGASEGGLAYEQKSLDLDYGADPAKLMEKRIEYWICENCGSTMQFPPPDQEYLSKYYQTSLTPQTDVKSYTAYKKKIFDERITFLLNETGLAGGAVLEAGCGNGDFLHRFAAKGFEVVGIEPSEKTGGIAWNVYDIPVISGTIESVDPIPLHEKFDLVLTMHTLEHVLNPQLAVRQMIKWVKPGGWLYIEVPDNEKVPGETMLAWGDNINAVHITHFTSKGLILLLMKEGITVKHISSAAQFRYPSLRVIGRKSSAFADGKSSFQSAAQYQENLYRKAGQRLIGILTIHPGVLLWGAGSDLQQILVYTPELENFEFCLVDRNRQKINKLLYGHLITDPNAHAKVNTVIITPASTLLGKEIEADAKGLFPGAAIIKLFSDKYIDYSL